MFGILSDMKDGYEKEVQAAKFNLERKSQEQERDYRDLTDKLNTLSQKLKLAEVLEESQREKVTSERLRQKRGKTTLFQVLQFYLLIPADS
jgi:outer membrane protein TolC